MKTWLSLKQSDQVIALGSSPPTVMQPRHINFHGMFDDQVNFELACLLVSVIFGACGHIKDYASFAGRAERVKWWGEKIKW